MKPSGSLSDVYRKVQRLIILSVAVILIGHSWLVISAKASEKLGHFVSPGCVGNRPLGERYRLFSGGEGYVLKGTMGETGADIRIPRAWLEPPNVKEEEEGAYVSSLNWSESVQEFGIGGADSGLHLSSYQVQEEGSAQMAVGRDVFLVLKPDGTLHPGLMDLGITQERGRVYGQWFARSHRFVTADIDGDGSTDLGVIKEEIPFKLSPDGIPEDQNPLVEQRPVQWYVYDRIAHQWVHNAGMDGKQTSEECTAVLPLIEMKMTPVEFVKRILHLK